TLRLRGRARKSHAEVGGPFLPWAATEPGVCPHANHPQGVVNGCGPPLLTPSRLTRKEIVFRFPPPTRLLKILVGGLAIAFVVEALADNWQGIGLVRLLALRVGDLHLGALWQVFTYPLAIFTPQIFSVLIQLFFCWWIIGDFERNVGTETTVMLLVFT